MAVNRHKTHLVVFVEDKPYRNIINGIKNLLFDVKDPCGGWVKVFETFEKNVFLLDKYKQCNMLLLIDFDDKNEPIETNFNKRIDKFNKAVPQEYKNRVFILGTNHKESEALKKVFNLSNFEDIGKLLVEDCPNSDLKHWQNIHLKCNLPEIERMKENGIFDWLFT